MTLTIDAVEADRMLKAKHRGIWALGDYPAVAAEVIPELGAVLVEACELRKGEQVLDIAAGTGNAAIPAALEGADVVASDLTPELLDAGRTQATQRGAELQWRLADAEALPFSDGEFDVVMSCVGVMFAPHHQAAADELVRVCRPGGRIGVLSWTRRGTRQRPARGPGHQPDPAQADGADQQVRPARGLPRVLQGLLRTDDRGLSRAGGLTRADVGAGPGHRRAGPAVQPRRRVNPDGLGVPAGDRTQGLSESEPLEGKMSDGQARLVG